MFENRPQGGRTWFVIRTIISLLYPLGLILIFEAPPTNQDGGETQQVFLPIQSRNYHTPQITFRLGNPPDLYIINSNGTAFKRLIDDPGSIFDYEWSPDGEMIAGVTDGFAGNRDIYVTKFDGSAMFRLTYHPSPEDQPAWSPDGQMLAYHSEGAIYLIKPDGTGAALLTDFPGYHHYPIWSPDGSIIAFITDHPASGYEFDIFIIHTDGTGLTPITQTFDDEFILDWSPDGAKILFLRGNGIYSIKIDGTGEKLLSEGVSAQYSPDGQMIAFVKYTDYEADIYRMDSDGENLIALTSAKGVDYLPRWSPDGSKIAFFSVRTGQTNLYLMNIDGSDQMPVTDMPIYSDFFEWRP